MKKKLKFKKLLNEYRSLTYEKKYVEAILKDWNLIFDIYYSEYCEKFAVNVENLNEKNSKKVDKLFKDQRALSKGIEKQQRKKEFDSKSLFRQIARKFHPDKIDTDDPRKSEYEEVFKKAANAIDNAKWGELFTVADEYDLDLRDYDQVIECLRLDIKRVSKEIEGKKSTYAWLLYECEEDEPCKQNVVKRFLKHLFNI